MSVSVFRNFLIYLTMVLVLPAPLRAQEKSSAILRSEGGVWVNGLEISGATTVFAGDLLETKPGFVANLDAEGSSVQIQPESIVKFQGTYLDLDHGAVSVGTSTEMSVHVKCIRVEPISNDRTQYEVGDLTGTVHVFAHKNDVKISHSGGLKKPAPENESTESSIVKEGQEAKREETDLCGGALEPETPGHAINTRWLEIGGGAAGAGLLLCLLLCKSSPPVSPSQP